MERLAIGVSLLVAGAVAALSFLDFGAAFPPFSFEHHTASTGSGGEPTPPGASPLAPGAAQNFPASALELRDAVVWLEVIPEDRNDLQIEVSGGAELPVLKAALQNGVLILDGELDASSWSCNENDGERVIRVDGRSMRMEDAQRVVVRAPRTLAVSLSGAVSAQIGPSQALTFKHLGCSDARLGDVAGTLVIETIGSGGVQAGASGSAEIISQGSGDIVLGAVAGALSATLQGSGAIRSAAVDGPATLSLTGSGDLSAGPVRGLLTAELAGPGELLVARAESETRLTLAGSGDLRIADGAAPRLTVDLAGSGDVEFAGVVGDLEANIAGSGDVRVQQVTGAVSKSVAGSGEVIIG